MLLPLLAAVDYAIQLRLSNGGGNGGGFKKKGPDVDIRGRNVHGRESIAPSDLGVDDFTMAGWEQSTQSFDALDSGYNDAEVQYFNYAVSDEDLILSRPINTDLQISTQGTRPNISEPETSACQ